METFPKSDLSPQLSAALLKEYKGDQEMRLPDWVWPFMRGELPQEGPPSVSDRVMGLSIIWSESKFNFAYWDQLPGEDWWDERYRQFLPKVIAAEDETAYWDILTDFANLLADGHTSVTRPLHLRANLVMPPIELRLVEGRPMVWNGEVLPRGTEILAVDGRPVTQVIEEQATKLSLGTHAMRREVAAMWLFRGPKGTQVAATVRYSDGTEATVVIDREGGPVSHQPCEVEDLGDGIKLVALNSFATEDVVAQFNATFSDFNGVNGLVLDLRRNGGGNTGNGEAIMRRLLLEPTLTGAQRLRCYMPTLRAWGMEQKWLVKEATPIQPDEVKPRFGGPIAVLSGPFTYSAAEDFLVSWQQAKRGPVIGQASGGSTGQPLLVRLPGGGAFRVCTKRDTFADGTVFVGKGIEPDIPCDYTLEGVRAGRDEVLERALEYVRNDTAR